MVKGKGLLTTLVGWPGWVNLYVWCLGKQTQTPAGWRVGERPPFALYGHRHDDQQTGTKKTYNVKAAKEVRGHYNC